MEDHRIYLDPNLEIEDPGKLNEKLQRFGADIQNKYDPETTTIVILPYRSGAVYIDVKSSILTSVKMRLNVCEKAEKRGKTVASLDWLDHLVDTHLFISPKRRLLFYVKI